MPLEPPFTIAQYLPPFLARLAGRIYTPSTTPAGYILTAAGDGTADWAANAGGTAVESVTAGDASISVDNTDPQNPLLEAGTLDQIANLHAPAANWSNNSKKITSLANGSAAQDAAAFGQIPTALPPNGAAGGSLSGTYPNPSVIGLVEASPSSDVTVSGITATFTAGETLAFGDPLYLKSDGKVWKADADGASTFPVVALSAASTAANAAAVVLLHGIARDDAWAWTVGGITYLSTSAGLTQTQPSATDNVIQPLAVALSATTLLFAPSLFYITHT